MKNKALIEQLQEYFANLIIMQYRSSQENRSLVAMLVSLLFANNLLLQIRDLCLNVEESEGAQLDQIGQWVGIDRFYNAIDLWDQPYESLVNYSNIASNSYEQWQGGMSNYSTFDNNDGGFLMYSNWKNIRTQVNRMGDDFFRLLIRLKIIKNSIWCTNKNIDEAIWKWSNEQVYITWGVMQLTYHYPSSMQSLFQLAVYKNVLPAPTGCTILTEAY